MIDTILTGLLSFITAIISVLLAPINLLIDTTLPDFSNMLTNVSDAFNQVSLYFGWIIDATCLNSNVISFFILFMTFRVVFPFSVSAIKVIVKWWHALAP